MNSHKKNSQNQFQLDVIILTKNRYQQLLRVATCLLLNSVPPKTLIVIDSSNEKDFLQTLHVIGQIAKQQKVVFLYKRVREKNIATARNIGVELSHSQYVAFLDDDEVPPLDWVAVVRETFLEDKRRFVITGVKIPSYPNNYWSQVWEGMNRKYYEMNGKTSFAPGGNTAFKREAVHKLGKLFDERFFFSGEDWSFSLKLKDCGYSIFLCKKMWVYHDFRNSLKDFWQQWVFYGKGAYDVFLYYRLKELNVHSQLKKYFQSIECNLRWAIHMRKYFVPESPIHYIGLSFAILAYFFGFFSQVIKRKL